MTLPVHWTLPSGTNLHLLILGTLARLERGKMDMTRDVVAARAKVHSITVARIEKGQAAVSHESRRAVLKAMPRAMHADVGALAKILERVATSLWVRSCYPQPLPPEVMLPLIEGVCATNLLTNRRPLEAS